MNKAVQAVEIAKKPFGTGIRFEKVGKAVRSVYTQRDGTVTLADRCRCRVLWKDRRSDDTGVSMSVQRATTCPIDEHSDEARHNA